MGTIAVELGYRDSARRSRVNETSFRHHGPAGRASNLEEWTCVAWLYDLMKPHVTELVVCDPRKNALLEEGNKGDKIDARKLADLLRGGYLRSVYHCENVLLTLTELAAQFCVSLRNDVEDWLALGVTQTAKCTDSTGTRPKSYE